MGKHRPPKTWDDLTPAPKSDPALWERGVLSVREAAELLGVGRNAVWEAMRPGGELERAWSRVGRRRVIARSVVLAALAGGGLRLGAARRERRAARGRLEAAVAGGDVIELHPRRGKS